MTKQPMNTASSLPTHPHFISLEGGEGAGKTTVLSALRQALDSDGLEVVATREPGGTALGERVRELLLSPADNPIHIETELLLMFAARVQHVHEVILPALARGAWVICDRFTDSSYAYQGAGRGLDMGRIEWLERTCVGLRPGLTLLLDLDIAHGRERARRRAGAPDRIESERDDFFERVRAGFRARAAAEPRRFQVLDAAQPAEVVAAEAVHALRALRARQPAPHGAM